MGAPTQKRQGIAQDNGATSFPTDRVTLGQGKAGNITYDPSLKGIGLETQYDLLRNSVVNFLQEQGIAVQVATDDGEIDISSLTQEDAQTLIAEDGYFGVEQTSERIFQFAIGIAGNDPSRIDQIRKGIEDGFKEAEGIWGGALPEISYQTMDATREKLDQWLEGFATGV